MESSAVKPRNIIFLDIDGVLNTVESLSNNVGIMPEKVLLLQNIASRTNASIVISSDWKHSFTLLEISKILYCAGLVGIEILGFTPNDSHLDSLRGENVDGYLEEYDYDNYVILDDLSEHNFYDHQIENLVVTDERMGLTYNSVEIAVGVLRGRKNVLLS